MRLLAAAIALGLGLATICAPVRGQESGLPDIGSSAAEMIDPSMDAFTTASSAAHPSG